VKRVGLLGLLLCALLLRAGIPTGMMLVAAEGGPRLVPCPSAWPALAVAPAAHHGSHHGAPRQPDHDHKGQEPPCPFGVLLFPGMPRRRSLCRLQPSPRRHCRAAPLTCTRRRRGRRSKPDLSAATRGFPGFGHGQDK